MRWQDVEIDIQDGVVRGGYVHVRHQLSRKGHELVRLKTEAGRRDVVLSPQLATLLHERKKAMLAAGLHGPEQFVFCTGNGTPISHRNATRAILAAAKRAGLDGVGFHLLRHGFASYLIVDLGLDVVQVAKQLGHKKPSITLDTYSHLFDQARNANTSASGWQRARSRRCSGVVSREARAPDPDKRLTSKRKKRPKKGAFPHG